MALKKSQLYSILWESCNVLRGSMDASEYKNYVLTMLFIKYISDKVKTDSDMFFDLPDGCSFSDIVNLKNKSNIGEEIMKILHKIEYANPNLSGILTKADFDDTAKLGSGKAMVDTISALIAVFQRDFLDFSSNRAADDDLIGDAYEYLMKNFAAESGKKKGQFYTPAEVSRLMALLIGVNKDTRQQITIYDPTCGSGSLLLRARGEAKDPNGVSIYGQELDGATLGMAKMNMYLHGVDDPELEVGDTIEKPKFKKNDFELETFDYVVANPPFSQKGWIKGEVKLEDRFSRWGSSDSLSPIPPVGYEDLAFLLHIITSLRSRGKAACILPNGVLFRGNEEANVRNWIINKKYIRGIISLPANLFFGTGIPACIIVVDKAKAATSKGIFMIDARDCFIKDGAKNRLREQDIRRIYDTWEMFENLETSGSLPEKEPLVEHFARFVPYSEITNDRNAGNLNVSRYITPKDTEVKQDLYAHLKLNGGLPAYNVDEDFHYLWQYCPSLKQELFALLQEGYYRLAVDKAEISSVVQFNREFRELSGAFSHAIEEWWDEVRPQMFALSEGFDPKKMLAKWSTSFLDRLSPIEAIVDYYDIYGILLKYWQTAMQDDCYLISREGWKVEISTRTLKVDKKSKEAKWVEKKNPTYEDFECDLLPVCYVIEKYFNAQQGDVNRAKEEVETIEQEIASVEEEYPDELDDSVSAISDRWYFSTITPPEEGEEEMLTRYLEIDGKTKEGKQERKELVDSFPVLFSNMDKPNQTNIKARLTAIQNYAPLDPQTQELYAEYIRKHGELKEAKETLKTRIKKLTNLVKNKYPLLTVDEIKHLVIDKKWHTSIVGEAIFESYRVTYNIEDEIAALAKRYERRLSDISSSVADLEKSVIAHLSKMGFEL